SPPSSNLPRCQASEVRNHPDCNSIGWGQINSIRASSPGCLRAGPRLDSTTPAGGATPRWACVVLHTRSCAACRRRIVAVPGWTSPLLLKIYAQKHLCPAHAALPACLPGLEQDLYVRIIKEIGRG